ncbi:MAG: FeoB-associated Cys-rich membrane protein [Selenomonadaceae bacterium]|nr:FeoB-associated Cys-rich membrane protein [Selenomonadaceae bacterium]MBR3721527.1 FeoB-associated Cys-rich membrane protein [Selenomonadaceae bacterium]
MADVIVGGVFFIALGFAFRHIYYHFKSGSCSCGTETSETCSCGGSCPHCKV